MTLWLTMRLRVATGAAFRSVRCFFSADRGYRQWQIDTGCDASTPLLSGTELQIIDNFQPAEEWLLGLSDFALPAAWGRALGRNRTHV